MTVYVLSLRTRGILDAKVYVTAGRDGNCVRTLECSWSIITFLFDF